MFPEVLYELFLNMPRQGPGNNTHTGKAYHLLANLPMEPIILDIGCGTGMQTLELARISGGKIVALDNYRPFLDTLDKLSKNEGLDNHIRTVNASMLELPFTAGTFDIIWSEGAIFIIGFKKGLREWKHLLRPSGYMIVSELCWLTKERPDEIINYMEETYPAINDIEGNEQIIRDVGYQEISNFILPNSVWLKEFYEPMQSQLRLLETKYSGNSETLEVLNLMRREINMYIKYSRNYSYVYYIMQAI